MSRALLSRIEKLEEASGVRREPLFIIFRMHTDGQAVTGYSWNGGSVTRRPGESAERLLERAEREALPMLEPWGGIVLTELLA